MFAQTSGAFPVRIGDARSTLVLVPVDLVVLIATVGLQARGDERGKDAFSRRHAITDAQNNRPAKVDARTDRHHMLWGSRASRAVGRCSVGLTVENAATACFGCSLRGDDREEHERQLSGL